MTQQEVFLRHFHVYSGVGCQKWLMLQVGAGPFTAYQPKDRYMAVGFTRRNIWLVGTILLDAFYIDAAHTASNLAVALRLRPSSRRPGCRAQTWSLLAFSNLVAPSSRRE
ncbi:hypothetical protein MUK42_37223 [Musa troglodytarum]|uniref:Uncharacterized protein n=1 Tax=Musa troglodytarum TaxID=320322 RepID=A0A9E7FLN0_9LILI|nr:hypothetical protein MUK42_37223 [Musa troglodytarum]